MFLVKLGGGGEREGGMFFRFCVHFGCVERCVTQSRHMALPASVKDHQCDGH